MKHILEFAIGLIKSYRNGEELPKHSYFEKRVDGLLSRMGEELDKYSKLQKIADERWGHHYSIDEITIISDDIAIVEVTEKGNLKGYFYILKDRASSSYSTDKETSILIALGEKHDGLNSQFSYYACRMLGKELE